jgi:hypothetical protein
MSEADYIARCVVCEREIAPGAERYANAWEASLELRACCGTDCAARFDGDEHWMPSMKPLPASDEELTRMLPAARARLVGGEDVTFIAKDLLLAGISTSTVRRALNRSAASSAATRESALGALFAGLFGRGRRRRRGNLDDVDALIQRWTERFAS